MRRTSSGALPDATARLPYWRAGGLEVARPPLYFDRRRRADRLTLELTPPAELYRAFDGDLDAIVHHLGRLHDRGVRALKTARWRPPLGAKTLRRLHPCSEPRTLRETG